MPLLKKISRAWRDPIFYRKRVRQLLRSFRSFKDAPVWGSVNDLGPVENVVVVIAHPDDETFLSGLICELVDAGSCVDLLCLTRGEGGPNGEVPREKLAEVRSEELRHSCDVIGVREIRFMGYIDPLGTRYRVRAPDVSVEVLSEELIPHLAKADLVISHGSSGEYWHPGHLLVFAAVKRAMQALARPGWLTMLARDGGHPLPHIVNWDDECHLRIDVSSLAEKRAAALSCHVTQLSLFQRWIQGPPLDFIKENPFESYCLQKRGKLQIAESADVGESQGNC